MTSEECAAIGLYHTEADTSICTFIGCTRPARYHLAITMDIENVTACDTHLDYAIRELQPLAGHELRVECTMAPGPVVWFDDGCRLPDDEAQVAAAVAAVA